MTSNCKQGLKVEIHFYLKSEGRKERGKNAPTGSKVGERITKHAGKYGLHKTTHESYNRALAPPTLRLLKEDAIFCVYSASPPNLRRFNEGLLLDHQLLCAPAQTEYCASIGDGLCNHLVQLSVHLNNLVVHRAHRHRMQNADVERIMIQSSPVANRLVGNNALENSVQVHRIRVDENGSHLYPNCPA